MTKEQLPDIYEKRIGKFWSLCFLSYIAVNGVFLIVSNDQYVSEKHVLFAIFLIIEPIK